MEDEEKTEIDPAEYFNPEAPRPAVGLLRKVWYPSLGVVGGITLGCLMNFMAKKPMFSGLQQHSISAGVGLILGTWMDGYVNRQSALRDAMIYHYITTHPDDFPVVERQKYKDVILPWVPTR